MVFLGLLPAFFIRRRHSAELAGTVLLAASSALCLRLMKKVGERLKKQQGKAKEMNK